MIEQSGDARNELLDSMGQVEDVVSAYTGIRAQFERAGWPREMANQIVADMFHKANCCRCREENA